MSEEINDLIDRTGLFIDHEFSADRLLLSYKLEKLAKLKALEAEIKGSTSARITPLQRRKDYIVWNKGLRQKYINMFQTQIRFETERQSELKNVQTSRLTSCQGFMDSLNSGQADPKKTATAVHAVAPISTHIIDNAEKGLLDSLMIWKNELEQYSKQVAGDLAADRQREAELGHSTNDSNPVPPLSKDKQLHEEFRKHTMQNLNSFNAEAVDTMQRMSAMIDASVRRRFVPCRTDLKTGLYEPVQPLLSGVHAADSKNAVQSPGTTTGAAGAFSSRYGGGAGVGSPGAGDLRKKKSDDAGDPGAAHPQHFTDTLWELGLKESDVRSKVASSKEGYDALALQLDTRLLDLHEQMLSAQQERLQRLDRSCEQLEH